MTHDTERVARLAGALDDFDMAEDLALPHNYMGATITDAVLQAGLRNETAVWPPMRRVMTIPEAATTSGFLVVLRERGGAEVVHWTHPEELGRRRCPSAALSRTGGRAREWLRAGARDDRRGGGARRLRRPPRSQHLDVHRQGGADVVTEPSAALDWLASG